MEAKDCDGRCRNLENFKLKLVASLMTKKKMMKMIMMMMVIIILIIIIC